VHMLTRNPSHLRTHAHTCPEIARPRGHDPQNAFTLPRFDSRADSPARTWPPNRARGGGTCAASKPSAHPASHRSLISE
jgi:hypothetical protein